MLGRLKRKIGGALRQAGGSAELSVRLEALEQSLTQRLDVIEAKLCGRLDEIARKTAVLEEFSHGGRATYVGNNRVLLKAVIGGANIAYFVEADDLLLTPWFVITGTYETDLTRFFLRALKPGSHCVDVGANFGFFTCLMARFCPDGKVLAIEANDRVFPLVRDNINANGFGHASALYAAASDKPGQLRLHRRINRSGGSSIAETHESYLRYLGEPPSEPTIVEAVRVDDVVSRLDGRVDFMKVDVEGAEPLVLEGARTTIARNPQIQVVMEWSPGQIRDAKLDVDAFLASLEGMGLQPFDLAPGGLKPLIYPELAQLPYRAGVVLTRPENVA